MTMMLGPSKAVLSGEIEGFEGASSDEGDEAEKPAAAAEENGGGGQGSTAGAPPEERSGSGQGGAKKPRAKPTKERPLGSAEQLAD